MSGLIIKKFRERNNYSQKELAKILDVSVRTIARWEQNNTKPNSDELKRLATLLSVTEDEILRTVAIFRYINPKSNIRLGAGRKLITENGIAAFKGGASATITGNMLTTSGSTIKNDREILTALGREVIAF